MADSQDTDAPMATQPARVTVSARPTGGRKAASAETRTTK
ncbi:hypothetical protein SAMN05216260_12556 [Streptomyces griseoaurantiacus]|uniref:Uncharacterized protein n=1 Tax=Streptomyces griseoaurantiacus TaxID=68213 RepID=A0A1G7W3T9_9ACTN|nr:hypothetical protein [Streptomyces sp. MH192]SDG66646.1 hypothetical protein SAMN05216260_12556 [Streptomyces jietaisiensis]